ncbi:MAG: GPH family glycoside/pentoside/hexuronide:cation symporter [Halioglobus sp.]|jgi:GPH family glycoside/pentoside/hexuronide:cation symporter
MVSLKTRILYGSGGAVYAVKEAAYSMFVLIFYTQVLGLSGTITGVVLSLALIWDGITDPLVGGWSDKLRSRFGRRHPFLALSILPLGLGFIGLFTPPQSVVENTTWLGSWLLFWTLWIRTFLTTFSIPHLALSAEITSDYQERSNTMGARMVFTFLFAVLLPAVGLLWIFSSNDGVDGRFVNANYPIYGALSCVAVLVMGTLTTWGTRNYIVPSTTSGLAAKGPRGNMRALLRDLVRTLENKTFRYMIGYEIAAMVSWGTISTLNILSWTYFWEFSATEVSIILALPSLVAIGLVMFTLRGLTARFQKHHLLQYALVALILNCLWLYPAKMLGLFPQGNETIPFVLNLVFMLIFMYCYLIRAITSYSIISDITDEHELDHGLRQEAGFFAVLNFIAKFAAIFGPVYAGIALDVIGLETGMLPGNVPLDTQNGLVYAMGLGIIPALLVAVYFVLKINLSKARVEDIQAQLRKRREQEAS